MEENKQESQGTDMDQSNMNRGELGESLGIEGSTNEQDEKEYSRDKHSGGADTIKNDTGGGADNGSKDGSSLGTDGSASNTGGQAQGSAANNI